MPSRLDSINPRSRRLLEDAGFTWDPDSAVWVNNRLGRAISYQTVQAHDPEWLRHWLQDSSA